MNSSKNIGVGVLLLACMSLGLSGCCCGDLDKSKDPEYMDKKVKELATWRKTLKAIHKATPKPSKAQKLKQCPDDVMKKELKDKKKTVIHSKLTTWSLLKKASKSSKKYTKGDDPWSWMVWDSLENLAGMGKKPTSARKLNDLLYWLNHDESRYLVVVRGDLKAPKPTEDPAFVLERRATAEAGKHFEPGSIEGWAYVFDTSTKKLLCQAPLSVASSKAIDFRTRGIAQKDYDDAIIDDFKDNTRAGLKQAIGAISKELAPPSLN